MQLLVAREEVEEMSEKCVVEAAPPRALFMPWLLLQPKDVKE